MLFVFFLYIFMTDKNDLLMRMPNSTLDSFFLFFFEWECVSNHLKVELQCNHTAS